VIKHETTATKELQDMQNTANSRTRENLITLETAIAEQQKSWSKTDAEMKIDVQLDVTAEIILHLIRKVQTKIKSLETFEIVKIFNPNVKAKFKCEQCER